MGSKSQVVFGYVTPRPTFEQWLENQWYSQGSYYMKELTTKMYKSFQALNSSSDTLFKSKEDAYIWNLKV